MIICLQAASANVLVSVLAVVWNWEDAKAIFSSCPKDVTLCHLKPERPADWFHSRPSPWQIDAFLFSWLRQTLLRSCFKEQFNLKTWNSVSVVSAESSAKFVSMVTKTHCWPLKYQGEAEKWSLLGWMQRKCHIVIDLFFLIVTFE